MDELIDAEESERERLVWGSMPHRLLPHVSGPFLRAERGNGFGMTITATVSLAPPEFADRLFMDTTICPICGAQTSPADRSPARLHRNYDRGLSFGFGAWVHRACFEGCPPTDQPTPIPW